MDEENAQGGAGTQGAGPAGFILAIVMLTVLGAAAGGAFAMMQVDAIVSAAEKKANEAPIKVDDSLAWSEESAVLPLDPVVSNLASPADVWVRLECAIVFEKAAVDDVDRLRAELAQNILAYLRTVTLGELTGASALAHLRDDLNERANVSTGGAVEELIIKSMVIQ